MRVVVKIGTSSLTDEAGRLDQEVMAKLAGEVADASPTATRSWW